MQKILFILLFIAFNQVGFSQEKTNYDEALAKKLDADDNGMKTYVFCILKTGTNTTATPEERKKLFEGHMANINKLADENKLVVAGPFMKNDKNYRGVFIFNCSTIEEAEKLVNSDPAVQAKIFEADLTVWYCTAALGVINETHNKIAKNKM
ncbi:MAG: YciI family protein [Bacteroidota bacterium]